MEYVLYILAFIILAGLGGVLILHFLGLLRRFGDKIPKIPGFEIHPEAGLADPLLERERKTAESVRLGFRLGILIVIVLLMLIPMDYLEDLVRERGYSHIQAVSQITSTWGGSQSVVGPFLVVPYTVQSEVEEKRPLSPEEIEDLQSRGVTRYNTYRMDKKQISEEKLAVILPEILNLDGRLEPLARQYSIYSSLLYSARLKISGHFIRPDLLGLDSRPITPNWERAVLVVGLSDSKAIREVGNFVLAGENGNFKPGTGGLILPIGFSGQVDLSRAEENQWDFSFDLGFNGSQSVFLAPLGSQNRFNLQSPWPHPSFIGSGLPDEEKTSDDGFEASWSIPNLVRSYPQMGSQETYLQSEDSFGSSSRLTEYLVGVKLLEPVDNYSLLERAVKFAILFVILTFLVVSIPEFGGTGPKLHPIQYGITGLALMVFYLLLLALSEHLGFTHAYIVAAVIDVIMISGYLVSSLGWHRDSIRAILVLAVLYAALYFILNMVEYALLTGSLLTVMALGMLMYSTCHLSGSKELE